MSLPNTIKSFQIPNIPEILKSFQNTKEKIDNLNINNVRVHYYYTDSRFKIVTNGIKVNIAEVPIVFIEEPEKLAFLVLDDSLIYNVTDNVFEIIVNERFTHSVILTDLDKFDNNIISKFVNELKLIIPINPSQFKLKEINIPNPSIKHLPINEVNKLNDTEKQIELLPNVLSSIGRAKLLQRTAQINNDGLLITLIIGFLLGAIIFTIIGIKL